MNPKLALRGLALFAALLIPVAHASVKDFGTAKTGAPTTNSVKDFGTA